MIFLYKVNYIRSSDQSAQILYLASAPYRSKKTDTPSNQKFEDRLKKGGSVSRYMFGFGRTTGQTEIGAGSIIAANGDAVLDDYKDEGFDFQKIEVYTVDDKDTAFADATLFATFIIEKAIFRWNEVEFVIRDPLYLINRPIQDSTFAGTNGDADDLEGNADDIKGQRKPVTIGKCYHVPMTVINTTSLIIGCHFDADGDPAALTYSDIYDQAYTLTDDGDDADSATMAAATITADYRTCEAEGLARLDATPNGTVTADVIEGASASDRTAAQCAKRAITNYAIGFTPAFDTATFTALDTADNSEVGYHSDGEDTLFEVAAALLGSVDAAILVDKNLQFYTKQLVDPSGESASETFYANDIVDRGDVNVGLEQVDILDDDGGIPSYKTTTLYKHYFHQFTVDDIAGGVSDEVRNDALQQFRRVEDETASVQNTYKSSRAIEIASFLVDSTDAESRNSDRHDLRKVARSMWILSLERSSALEIGDVIKLQVDRYGMSSGKNFFVLGYDWQEITEPIVDYLIYG